MCPTYFLPHFNLVELAHVVYCTTEPVLVSPFGHHFLKVLLFTTSFLALWSHISVITEVAPRAQRQTKVQY